MIMIMIIISVMQWLLLAWRVAFCLHIFFVRWATFSSIISKFIKYSWSEVILLVVCYFQFLLLDDIKEAKNIDLKEDEDDSQREVLIWCSNKT